MKRIRAFIATLTLLFSFGVAPILLPATALAADNGKSEACVAVGSDANCANDGGGISINNLVAVIVNILSIVVGITAIIMIIVAGFNFVTSGGDSNKVSSARSTILYAVIGLVIVALAQFIVRFVLDKAIHGK
jgi:hypothetical protein